MKSDSITSPFSSSSSSHILTELLLLTKKQILNHQLFFSSFKLLLENLLAPLGLRLINETLSGTEGGRSLRFPPAPPKAPPAALNWQPNVSQVNQLKCVIIKGILACD